MSGARSHLTRLILRRDAPQVQPLLADFLPELESEAMAVQHKLLWTAFPNADRQQDAGVASPFLWRQTDGKGEFLALGPAPLLDSPWFKVESKPFALSLHAGQQLAFDLRVNATVNRQLDAAKGRAGRKRCDVVMDAIYHLSKAPESRERAEQREPLARQALSAWLDRKGEAGGFTPSRTELVSHRTVPVPKKTGKKPLVGVADLTGLLTVTDPELFLQQLSQGFGHLKAFGCGLMLVKPAPLK